MVMSTETIEPISATDEQVLIAIRIDSSVWDWVNQSRQTINDILRSAMKAERSNP